MSARRLLQRPKARWDILSIVAYVTDHNPAAARALYGAYDQALLTLRTHPEAGRRYVPDHAAWGNVRMLQSPASPTTCFSPATIATQSR